MNVFYRSNGQRQRKAVLAQSGERQRSGKRRLREGKRGRRRAGVAPAGAGWGVSCPGTSNFLLLSKESYQRKPLETTFQDFLGAGRASANLAVLASRNWCGGHHCRSKGLCLRSPARRLPRPLAPATVGVFASTGLAIIKSRLCRRKAAKVGVPVGHGYIYFLAFDTAERIIFAIVAGSGSGKLCWHSRGNDNDQENAGYVRESAGGSEQA